MRVVVTGGTGFVGAHVARALVERGDEVTVLDVVGSSPVLDGVGVSLVRCDVGSWAELFHAVRAAGPELIVHAAGILSAFAEERPQAAYHANATGTYNVLEAAALLGRPRVIFTSTIATYGPGVGAVVDEGTRQRPTTMYGVTKTFGELLGAYYAGRFGVDFRGIRLPAVIGAGRGPGGASAYSSLAVSEPAHGRPYAVPVAESTRIPLVYIRDAVAALLAIAAADASRLRHRTYGIAGFSPTAAELVAAVRAEIPDAAIEFRPEARLREIVAGWPEVVDASDAFEDWGWRERFDLAAAVGDFVAEIRANPGWP